MGNKPLSEDLQRIHTAGRHLLSLINGILDLSKIEAGKMELDVETFDISDMLQDVVALPNVVIGRNALITNPPLAAKLEAYVQAVHQVPARLELLDRQGCDDFLPRLKLQDIDDCLASGVPFSLREVEDALVVADRVQLEAPDHAQTEAKKRCRKTYARSNSHL